MIAVEIDVPYTGTHQNDFLLTIQSLYNESVQEYGSIHRTAIANHGSDTDSVLYAILYTHLKFHE